MKHLLLTNPHYQTLEKEFKTWLTLLGYAESTIYQLPHYVREFFHYLEEKNITCIENIGHTYTQSFFNYLTQRNNQKRGGGLSENYLNKHLQALKNLSKYLKETGQSNFTTHIPRLKQEQTLKTILSEENIRQLYHHCATDTLGQRDRAILSILYGCGLRRNEAINLNVKDLLFSKGLIYVRKGKNYKERYVPFNQQIKKDLIEYLDYSRPHLLGEHTSEALLISMQYKRINGQSIMLRVKALAAKSGLNQAHITLHTLRHSIATHLLHKGMELEHIARFLGHSSLESTQIYTHLTH